jgi:hypothetical protein
MPDVVDGARYLVAGHLGQGIGHSLIGLAVLCWPAGNVVLLAAHRVWISNSALSVRIGSVLVGALSHLVFDFVSHDKFLWGYPWVKIDFFPAWWTAHWAEIKTPFYDQPYPIGPHFCVWVILSIAGAILFFAKRP